VWFIVMSRHPATMAMKRNDAWNGKTMFLASASRKPNVPSFDWKKSTPIPRLRLLRAAASVTWVASSAAPERVRRRSQPTNNPAMRMTAGMAWYGYMAIPRASGPASAHCVAHH
jgi:hypothetical protein